MGTAVTGLIPHVTNVVLLWFPRHSPLSFFPVDSLLNFFNFVQSCTKLINGKISFSAHAFVGSPLKGLLKKTTWKFENLLYVLDEEKIFIFIPKAEAALKKLSDGIDLPVAATQKSSTRIVLSNPDSDHPGLSFKAKVVYSKEKGRYLVAKEAIHPGELVQIFIVFDKPR